MRYDGLMLQAALNLGAERAACCRGSAQLAEGFNMSGQLLTAMHWIAASCLASECGTQKAFLCRHSLTSSCQPGNMACLSWHVRWSRHGLNCIASKGHHIRWQPGWPAASFKLSTKCGPRTVQSRMPCIWQCQAQNHATCTLQGS
jgi:hypothetical protein